MNTHRTVPTLVLVAHGTRNPRGVEMIAELADAVGRVAGETRVAFVDVLGPSPSEVLRGLGDTPAVVVPAFLASGYHVHTDVPREVADSGHTRVVVTEALGPDPVFARVMLERLRAVGWNDGDAIVFAAAGSSDQRALREHRRATAMLAEIAGVPVRIGYVATAQPAVPDAVTELRRQGHRKVFVASYLLARGLFHSRLVDAGSDGVADPLGIHAGIVELVVDRFRSGAAQLENAGLIDTGLSGREEVVPRGRRN